MQNIDKNILEYFLSLLLLFPHFPLITPLDPSEYLPPRQKY